MLNYPRRGRHLRVKVAASWLISLSRVVFFDQAFAFGLCELMLHIAVALCGAPGSLASLPCLVSTLESFLQ